MNEKLFQKLCLLVNSNPEGCNQYKDCGGGGNSKDKENNPQSPTVKRGKIIDGPEGYRVSYKDVGRGTRAGIVGVIRDHHGNMVARTPILAKNRDKGVLDAELGLALRDHLKEGQTNNQEEGTKTPRESIGEYLRACYGMGVNLPG